MESLSCFLAGGKFEREIQPRANFCNNSAREKDLALPILIGEENSVKILSSFPPSHEARVTRHISQTGREPTFDTL
jgi:hypothetical protein